MTTIIIIVVVALVFFVTICVVTFMVWKRETEMRTDSIKAIENNLEEVLYELSGESTTGLRERRRMEEDGEPSHELQKPDDGKINRGRSLDPFSWVRAEIEKRREQADEVLEMDGSGSAEDMELEAVPMDNGEAELTVFDPDAKERALELERKRLLAEARKRDVTWVEVAHGIRESIDDAKKEDVLPESGEERFGENTGLAMEQDAIIPADPAEAEPAEEVGATSSPETEELSSTASDDPLDLDGPPDLGTLEDLIELTSPVSFDEPSETVPEPSETSETLKTVEVPEMTETAETSEDPEATDLTEPSTVSEGVQPGGLFYENLQNLYGLLQNLEQPVVVSEMAEEPADTEQAFALEGDDAPVDTEEGNDPEEALDALIDIDSERGGASQWNEKPKIGYNVGKSGKEYTVSELEALIKE